MSNYLFEGDFTTGKNSINVQLFLVHFKDENNVDIVFSPHMDLSGYGKSLIEAQLSFEYAIDDFIEYAVKNNTLHLVFEKLRISLISNKIRPSIADVIGSNKYFAEIFDKYPVQTFHKNIGILNVA